MAYDQLARTRLDQPPVRSSSEVHTVYTHDFRAHSSTRRASITNTTSASPDADPSAGGGDAPTCSTMTDKKSPAASFCIFRSPHNHCFPRVSADHGKVEEEPPAIISSTPRPKTPRRRWGGLSTTSSNFLTTTGGLTTVCLMILLLADVTLAQEESEQNPACLLNWIVDEEVQELLQCDDPDACVCYSEILYLNVFAFYYIIYTLTKILLWSTQ